MIALTRVGHEGSLGRLRRTYSVGTLGTVTKPLAFEWDRAKARANLRKHGVAFEEARTVFLDESALLRPDDEHSADEARFVLLGLSSRLRIVLVCHCYRRDDEVIRIISARKATASERLQYDERRGR